MNPVLVLEGATWWNVPLAVATALIGMFGVSGAMLGYFRTNCNLLERLILFVGGISLIDPGLVTDAIGIGILALIYFLQARRSAR
ncbi:MAG: DUF3394 domain-containing protein [Planifilum fimeticola]